MGNPVSIVDLEARWPLASDPPPNAETKLDEAWRALLAELPVVQSRIDSGALDVEIVMDVVCAAATRDLRNPEGFVRLTTTIDDRTKSGELNPDDVNPGIYFTATEKRRLLGVTAEVTSFTVTPASPRSTHRRAGLWSPGWR